MAVSHQPPPSGEPGGSSWPQVLGRLTVGHDLTAARPPGRWNRS
ncbi:hypothetical protein I553_3411 [Mycobacterium xenopi 4042]|uniref:Uncharacterized protein n=1 Tax=Mycobacterium xenopi 4042 TaxID=1299334 RepID=X7ZYX2_MYCXE|nr:hypothetical protein I553_3411 [Mycobacterium xenopi 4042]